NFLLDLVVFGRAAGLHLQESIAEQVSLRDASESDIDYPLDRHRQMSITRCGDDPVANRKTLHYCIEHNFVDVRAGDEMREKI
ncbi:succinate dehydrogenase flavoprotein subunit, partial [Escherichia coli]|nr:succinate dehydrogenase flavoprotein subunit [Escherichia coli]